MENNKESITRASELLLGGATMLQISCPECFDPIYKLKDGTMKCATCNRQVFFERQLTDHQRRQIQEIDSPVRKKIDELTSQLEQEEDPDKIIKLAETIKKLKEIL